MSGPAPTVVKLGGSVITEKDAPETVDDAALVSAADALAGHDGPLVVVHGGGSFGHHHAEAHGVSSTKGTEDASSVRAIHAAMRDLNDRVVGALADAGLPAVPVPPLAVASRDTNGRLDLPSESVATLLAEGFVPVTHGDVVAHAGAGATILSGDEIVVSLTMRLAADRVGVCSTVPGVLDADGDVIDRISDVTDVEAALSGSDETDVTGGMGGKVRSLLEMGRPAQVFGPADLPAFVAGEAPGTTIDGR